MDAMTPPDALAQLKAMQPDVKPVTHDVTIVTQRKLAQAKVLGVPPEEFGIERNARDIKTCNYAFHEVVTKTASQLIAEGFDEDQIEALGEYTGNNDIETLARDSVLEHGGHSGANAAARLVKITEHYVRMDYEGKGRACLYMVVTGGDNGEVLKKDGKEVIEPIDVIPFATTTPVPITHRFFGRSMADLVMPLQREKTAMKRGALDNMYMHNNPRPEISEAHCGASTLDDLLTHHHGAIIRTKMPGGLIWQEVPDITGSIYPMLQYLDAELETRTGVSKQTQGIDANALQNQSAQAVAQVFSASQMRMKLIARIMAEGVRDMFSLLHHTIRSHGQEQQTVRLRNQWVDVDPRNWKTRNDMTINVGLGTGSRAQQFAQGMALLNIQKELLMGGKANLVDDQALFNSVSDIAKIMGHKNADKYINDPTAKDPQTGQLLHPPVPPPPDPKLAVEQFKAQSAQAAADHKAQLEQAKAQTDALHQQLKTNSEIEIAKVKAELDAKIAIINAHVKMVEAEQKARHAEQQHKMDMRQGAMDMVATAQSHDATMAQGQQSHGAKMEQTDATHKAKLEQMKNAPKPKGGK